MQQSEFFLFSSIFKNFSLDFLDVISLWFDRCSSPLIGQDGLKRAFSSSLLQQIDWYLSNRSKTAFRLTRASSYLFIFFLRIIVLESLFETPVALRTSSP